MYTKHFGVMMCAVYVGIDCLTTSASLCVPGFVCQAGWYGGADCVPVVRGSELTVSPPLPSETRFQIDFFE